MQFFNSVSQYYFIRAANVMLRGITLLTRFAFIFVLAKFLGPDSFGAYGLFTATVGYILYIVGLDYYTFTSRELLARPKSQSGAILKGQIVLSLILYMVTFPIALYILAKIQWPPLLLMWFVPITILEHINQELGRLLVAMSQQLFASILLFVRQASWAIAIVILMSQLPSSHSLDYVFPFWAVSGLCAATLGCMRIYGLRFGGWKNHIDWQFILRGIKISLFFLTATLALRAVQTIDRYWLDSFAGTGVVGVYVLYIGVAGVLLAFLDAGVFSFGYPQLIKFFESNDTKSTNELLRRMWLQTLVISAIYSCISYLALPYLLRWVGNPLYESYSYIFPMVMLASVLNALSMIPHYALYAMGDDKPIIHSHYLALLVFLLTVWTCSGVDKITAVPIALIVSFFVILLWKSFAYCGLLPRLKEFNKYRE